MVGVKACQVYTQDVLYEPGYSASTDTASSLHLLKKTPRARVSHKKLLSKQFFTLHMRDGTDSEEIKTGTPHTIATLTSIQIIR